VKRAGNENVRKTLLVTAGVAHKLTMALCVACLLVVLFSMTANVILRHALSSGYLALQDLSVYAFSILAILAIPSALAEGRHVRIDRSQGGFAGRGPGNVLAMLVFLLPMAGLLFAHSVPQFWASLIIREGSGQIGGLGGLFVVKAFLPIGAFLIALQGVAALVADVKDANEHASGARN